MEVFNMIDASATSEERRELERAILSVALDAAIIVNSDQTIVEWNRAAEEIFGHTRDTAIGCSMPCLIIPLELRDQHAAGLERYRVTARGPVINRRVETEALRADGSTFPIELAVSPIEFRGHEYFIARIRDISDRRAALQQTQALIYEMNHRTRNMLTMVTSMLRLTKADSTPEYIEKVTGRIHAISDVHSDVVSTDWKGARIRALVERNLRAWSRQITVIGPEITLNPSAAQALGVIVHEMAVNAGKWGGLSNDTGRVSVSWAWEDNVLTFLWEEIGGPVLDAKPKPGLGHKLIRTQVESVFHAPFVIEWGTSVVFRLQIADTAVVPTVRRSRGLI